MEILLMLPQIYKTLEKQNVSFFIIGIIILSIFLKIILSINSFGPYAIDDYNHNVIPAYAIYKGLEPEIPAYRSPLFVWILKNLFEIGSFIGFKEKIDLLKFLNFSLGILFFFSNIGLYLYLKSKKVKKSLILFIFVFYNLNFYILYASTKAFGEFFSVIFVLLGIGLIEYYKDKKIFLFLLGIFLFGFSSFFRFQNGVLYVGYIVYWLFFRDKQKILYFFAIGILLLFLQGIVDVFFGREPLSTLLNYLKVNKDVSEVYGKTGYFSYIFLFLGFSLFPFSFIFLKSFKKFYKLIQTHGIIFFLFILFLIVHSLIPHQEERFIFPIVSFFIVMFSQIIYYYKNNEYVKKFYFYILILFYGFALIIVLFNNHQVGSYLPIAKMSEKWNPLTIYYRKETFTKNPYLSYFFAFDKKIEFYDINQQKDSLPKLVESSKNQYVAFLTNSEEIKLLWDLEKNNIPFYCSDWIKEFSFIDEILFKLNPKMNARRAPTYYFYCDKNILLANKY